MISNSSLVPRRYSYVYPNNLSFFLYDSVNKSIDGEKNGQKPYGTICTDIFTEY